MAWFGNVSLGNFPNLAGAVNKLSESVKNIEKNFDSVLGLEEKADGASSASTATTSEVRLPEGVNYMELARISKIVEDRVLIFMEL